MAPDKPFDRVQPQLQNVKVRGRTATARCPAHDDRQNSLSLKETEKGDLLINCFAGCANERIVECIGWQMSDLFADKSDRPRESAPPVVVATYDYRDAAGELVFQVLRLNPKSFRQRRPDPDRPGEWIWNLKGVTTPIYRLPEVEALRTEGRSAEGGQP